MTRTSPSPPRSMRRLPTGSTRWQRIRPTVRVPALGRETDAGSQIAQTSTRLLGRQLRLIVRRQPRAAGEQLAIDDLDGWRLHAIITNIDPTRMSAAEVGGASPVAGRDPRGHHPVIEERLRDEPRPSAVVLRQLAVLAGSRLGTTSRCGYAPWRCQATTGAHAANDSGSVFSTSPPGWSATAVVCTCASVLPIATCGPSSPR
jgi:hypothetical protein